MDACFSVCIKRCMYVAIFIYLVFIVQLYLMEWISGCLVSEDDFLNRIGFAFVYALIFAFDEA